MDRQEKQEIAAAIVALKGRVSLAEVVSLTGLPVLTVNRCLNSMAYDCGAHLEVNSDGSLNYIFSPNFDLAYKMSGFQKACKLLLSVLKKSLYVLVKLLLGTTLFLSTAFFYALTFCLLEIMSVFTNMESSTGQMRREFFQLLWTFFRSPLKSPAAGAGTKLAPFLENCFAFLFGPEDPNSGLKADSWRRLARLIKGRNGVVLPQELRLCCMQDNFEAFDMKALVRLNGMPLVTDGGTILYSFSELLSRSGKMSRKSNEDEGSESAESRFSEDQQEEPEAGSSPSAPLFLQERFWHFSGVASRDLIPVLALALLNLAGCNAAYFGLHAWPAFVKQAPLYWGITFLWMYGNTFLAFPLLRLFLCALRNHHITVRNATRKVLAEELQYPSPELASKLEEARLAAAEMARQAGQASLVFSTEHDSLEQQFRP